MCFQENILPRDLVTANRVWCSFVKGLPYLCALNKTTFIQCLLQVYSQGPRTVRNSHSQNEVCIHNCLTKIKPFHTKHQSVPKHGVLVFVFNSSRISSCPPPIHSKKDNRKLHRMSNAWPSILPSAAANNNNCGVLLCYSAINRTMPCWTLWYQISGWWASISWRRWGKIVPWSHRTWRDIARSSRGGWGKPISMV